MARKKTIVLAAAALGFVGTAAASDCWVNGPYFVCGAPGTLWCPHPSGGQPIDCRPTQSPAAGCTIREVRLAAENEIGKFNYSATTCLITRTTYTCPIAPGVDCVFDQTVIFNCGGTETDPGLNCVGGPVGP